MGDIIMAEFEKRINDIEEYLKELNTGFKGMVHKCLNDEFKNRFAVIPQAQSYFGLMHALVIDTKDVWKQGRIRYFNPLMHKPGTDVKKLPWAFPISNMGGFDDCGLVWVPPAGSTVAILFEAGDRQSAFYIGTIWTRDRGDGWGDQTIQEYEDLHRDHRGGYLLGDDETQVLPQWNTENYNGIDVNSVKDLDTKPDAYQHLTYPNIYGFKTPQKHMLKMVDGDYNCSQKHKRIEMLSSCGNWLLMKDDHMRAFVPKGGYKDCSAETEDCKNQDGNSKYFKNKNELRPWNGVGTPQNNKCVLKQSGIQMLSVSGHTFYMDDSVDQPKGTTSAGAGGKSHPGCPWERSLKPFDFGCNDKFKGRLVLLSATGHRLEMSDEESNTNVRSENNYIRLLSACGNKIELNDHSINDTTSGAQRGIHIQSTSNHTIDLVDEQVDQVSPARKEGGTPSAKAKKAYVKIRSGYGLEIRMDDQGTQESTDSQFIQIYSPQKDNTERGPHILRMTEKNSGPGQVYLQVGGNYMCVTHDSHTTTIGDKDKNPADWIVSSSRNSVIVTEQFYMNTADTHMFSAKHNILLMAGEDCPNPTTGVKGPCVWPVLCLSDRGITISDRVYASASNDAECASIFHLLPFHEC